MTQFSCIKCGSKYESSDDEAYLCEKCKDARQVLAKQIDAKIGSTVGQQPSGLQALEDKVRAKGGFAQSADGKMSKLFINVRDL